MIFLALSWNGDCADIEISPQILIYAKTENFPAFFSVNCRQLSELGLKIILINLIIIWADVVSQSESSVSVYFSKERKGWRNWR